MPVVVRVNGGNRRSVAGLTSIDGRRIFVLRWPCEQQIEVYDATVSELQQTLHVAGLCDHHELYNGLTSCTTNKCLYVGDFGRSTVYKIALQTGDDDVSTWHYEVSTWQVDNGPRGFSVNTACNLLVTCRTAGKLQEYTSSGSLVREINLQLDEMPMCPWHAIQLSSDVFIVCLAAFGRSSLRADVAEVNSQGRVVISYKNLVQSTTKQQFNAPRHLAVDRNGEFIYLADRGHNRIVVLNRLLNCVRELKTSVEGSGLQGPQCLYLDESSNRLYVGEDISWSSVSSVRRINY
jgi:hypothetical protein